MLHSAIALFQPLVCFNKPCFTEDRHEMNEAQEESQGNTHASNVAVTDDAT